jgi:hypothetical protein
MSHERIEIGKNASAVTTGFSAVGRRRWLLAIIISTVFHMALGWTLFEAGVHWPLAHCEPIDTRVPPPIDAVTVDLSDTSTQDPEAEGAPAPAALTRCVTPQEHVKSSESVSVVRSVSSAVPKAGAREPVGPPATEATTPGGNQLAMTQRPKNAKASALPGTQPVRKVVYVIDRSASMGPGGALERAAGVVGESIAALPVEAQFQIVFYNRQAELLPTDHAVWLWPASAQGKASALELLRHWRAEGSTDHLRALRAALSLRPEVIYWLTDGADLTSVEIDSITRSNKWITAINTIGMGRGGGAGSEPLQRVALANRGIFRQLGSTGD